MKKLLFTVLTVFSVSAWAQFTPQKFNYQAVARDANGTVLANDSYNVVVSIYSDATASTLVYSEEHSGATNDFGLFYFKVGEGANSNPAGGFANIDWGNEEHWINVNYNGDDLGTTELISVPYALVSASSNGLIGAPIDVTTAPSNGDALVYNNGVWQVQSGINGLNSIIADGGASTTCANGGTILNYGRDTDNSGVLDPGEIEGSIDVCNGINGTNGNTWTTGTGAPAGAGNAGDMYLNTTNNDYYSYDGTSWILDGNLNGNQITSTLVNNGDGSFTYTDETGAVTSFDTTFTETTTTLVNNGDGTFSFTNELGAVTTFDTTAVQTTSTLVNNGDGSFTYTDETGAVTSFDTTFTETTTTLVNNGDGTFSFTNELGAVTTFDTTAVQTTSTLVNNGDGSFSYTDETGAVTSFDTTFTETTTTLVNNGDGTFSFTNELGAITTFDTTSVQTTSTLVNNGDGSFTYTDETGAVTSFDTTFTETTTTLINNGDGTFSFTNELGAVTTFDTTAIDGNGIYDGSGTVPSATAVTITDNINFANSSLNINGTNESVGMGTAGTTQAKLSVFEDTAPQAISVTSQSTGGGGAIGIRTSINNSATGTRYGVYNFVTNGASGSWTGTRNYMETDAGGTANLYGTTNDLRQNGTGIKMGTSNTVVGGGSSNVRGTDNNIAAQNSSGNAYGTHNLITGAAGALQTAFGSYSRLTGGDGIKYGSFSFVTQTASEATYGFYSNVAGPGNNKYGFYSTGEDRNYLSGSLGIGTSNPSNRLEVVGDAAKFDSVIIVNGAQNGYVLSSNATGNASWVDPTTLGASPWTDAGTKTYLTDVSDSVAIGTTTPFGKFHVSSENGFNFLISETASSGNADHSGNIGLVRSRGTLAAKSNVLTGDRLGSLSFNGYNSGASNYEEAGYIVVEAAEDFNSTGSGGIMKLATTPNGLSSPQTAITIDQTQNVGFGTENPLGKIHAKSQTSDAIGLEVVSSAGNYGELSLLKTAGSIGAETGLSTGDDIGALTFIGYNDIDGGYGNGPAARVRAQATENYSSTGNRGAKLMFEVAQNAGAGIISPLEIDQQGDVVVTASGNLVIPTGATAGHVLTSDATGRASWQALGNPVSLGDGDNDTRVDVEATTDDDFVRFTTNGVERMVVDNNGMVGIGTSAPGSALHVGNGPFGTGAQLSMVTNRDAQSGGVAVFRSRGTPAAPAGLQLNDQVGYIEFSGHDGTTFGYTAGISVFADENYAGVGRGSRMQFDVTPNGGTTPNTALTIDSDGHIGIGTLAPTQNLDVAGVAEIDSLRINNAYALPSEDGTNGQMMTTDGAGVVSWVDAPFNPSRLSLPYAFGNTAVTTAGYDIIWSTGTTNPKSIVDPDFTANFADHEITINTTGTYRLYYEVTFENAGTATAANTIETWLRRSPGTNMNSTRSRVFLGTEAGNSGTSTGYGYYDLNAGDVIWLRSTQIGGDGPVELLLQGARIEIVRVN